MTERISPPRASRIPRVLALLLVPAAVSGALELSSGGDGDAADGPSESVVIYPAPLAPAPAPTAAEQRAALPARSDAPHASSQGGEAREGEALAAAEDEPYDEPEADGAGGAEAPGTERKPDDERAPRLTPEQELARNAEETAMQPPPPPRDDRPLAVRDAEEEAAANARYAPRAREHEGAADRYAQRLDAEPPNEAATLSMQRDLDGLGLGAALQHVACGSTLCAASLNAGSVAEARRLFQLETALARETHVAFTQQGGELAAVLYVAREGHDLSGSEVP